MIATNANAAEWIEAIATAVAVVFAIFAWWGSRGTTKAQAVANGQQAEALKIQADVLEHYRMSREEERATRLAEGRARAARVKVTEESTPFVAFIAGGHTAQGGGEPLLRIVNESGQTLDGVWVGFFDDWETFAADGPRTNDWMDVMHPNAKWEMAIPGEAFWVVEFTDLEGQAWRLDQHNQVVVRYQSGRPSTGD